MKVNLEWLNGHLAWTLIAGIGTVVGSILAIPKLYQWLRPIRVYPSINIVFDGSERDEIRAKIINRSREAQYVIKCRAKSTYSILTILKKHLRHPFTPPRLYSNIWFGPINFDLLNSPRLKLEPFEPIDLEHRLATHPLSKFLTPMFQIEVHLSTGRVFRSRRMDVPDRWRFISNSRQPFQQQ